MAGDTRALSARGSRAIPIGASARVERAGGDVWSGWVSYVSGEVVGLKASTTVAGLLKPGDTVTLIFGRDDSMVSAQARVLAASGSFLRLSRRESSEGLERRRALRVPVQQPVEITFRPPNRQSAGTGSRAARAELTDMSASGCALRTAAALCVGESVEITLSMFGNRLTLGGKIVRTWRTDETRGEHAGVQFDRATPETAGLVNRYLVAQLRETSHPRPGCARRPGPNA